MAKWKICSYFILACLVRRNVYANKAYHYSFRCFRWRSKMHYIAFCPSIHFVTEQKCVRAFAYIFPTEKNGFCICKDLNDILQDLVFWSNLCRIFWDRSWCLNGKLRLVRFSTLSLLFNRMFWMSNKLGIFNLHRQ